MIKIIKEKIKNNRNENNKILENKIFNKIMKISS
jgi:hypothetical protein